VARDVPELPPEVLAALRAAELRMIAGLLRADGQHGRAADAEHNALLIDPPKGRA